MVSEETGASHRRTTSERPRLDALTGLRFLAAVHVLVLHQSASYSASLPWWLGNIVDRGYVAVSLFFVLSGFVLAYVTPEGAASGGASRAFWIARFARVYPVYALGLLVSLPHFLVAASERGDGVARVLTTGAAVLTLTQAWFPSRSCSWNCPGWSLSAEAFFYLVFPLLSLLLSRLRHRGLIASVAALWVVSVALSAVPLHPGVAEWRHVHVALERNPLVRLPEFAAGVAMGRVFSRTNPEARPLTGALVAPFALAGVAAVLVAGSGIPRPLLHNGLLTPLFALLVWSLAGGRGAVAAAFSRPAAVRLGEASYAVYALHVPILLWMESTARWTRLDPHSPSGLALLLVVAVGASLQVLDHLEEPTRRAIRRRWGGSRGGSSTEGQDSRLE